MNNTDIQGNRQIFLCTVVPLASTFSSIDFTSAAEKIAKSAGLIPVEWNSYSYPNGGGTFIWFLSESHIAIDTYPEHHLVEITLLSCKPFRIEPVIETIGNLGWIVKDYTNFTKDKDHNWLPC